MAQHFLAQLPWANSDKLPDGAECMICREKYGTFPSDNGILEHAVLLPCAHHVGSECIAIWLSISNSCPLCRTAFSPSRIGEDDDEEPDQDDDEEDEDDYSDEDEEEDNEEEDDEQDGEGGNGAGNGEDEAVGTDAREQTPMTFVAAFERLAFSSVNTAANEETEAQDHRKWYERWPLPTTQQFEDSENRARQALIRPPPSGFMQRQPQTYAPPADLESKVKELASADRTMAFRETLLYLAFQWMGARIPPLEFPHRGLSPHHEAHLLWEMGQRGAFNDEQVRPAYMAMTNRQSWFVHRAKGEVYTYEQGTGRGYWSKDIEIEGLLSLSPRMHAVLGLGNDEQAVE